MLLSLTSPTHGDAPRDEADDELAWGARFPWLVALAGAVWPLVAALSISAVVPVGVWLSEGAEGSVGDPLRFGSWVWLLSHKVALHISGAEFSVAPLVLTAMFLLLLFHSGRWVARSSEARNVKDAGVLLGIMTVTYAVGAAIIALVASDGDVTANALAAVLWACVWAVLAAGLGIGYETRLLKRFWGMLPPLLRAAIRGGLIALMGLLICGVVMVLVALSTGSGRIADLFGALDGGVMGTFALLAASVMAIGNVAVWGAAFSLGPGFSVGVDTSVSPAGVELGSVPALPILGALPEAVPHTVAWLVLAGPLIVGIIAGRSAHHSVARSKLAHDLTAVLPVAVGVGVVAALGMAVLAALSGGSAGQGRLAVIGASPPKVAAFTLVLIGGPAVVVAISRYVKKFDPEAEATTD